VWATLCTFRQDDKLACRYRAAVQIANILIWLRARPDRPKP
jgi:hypothetical protein